MRNRETITKLTNSIDYSKKVTSKRKGRQFMEQRQNKANEKGQSSTRGKKGGQERSKKQSN